MKHFSRVSFSNQVIRIDDLSILKVYVFLFSTLQPWKEVREHWKDWTQFGGFFFCLRQKKASGGWVSQKIGLTDFCMCKSTICITLLTLILFCLV